MRLTEDEFAALSSRAVELGIGPSTSPARSCGGPSPGDDPRPHVEPPHGPRGRPPPEPDLHARPDASVDARLALVEARVDALERAAGQQRPPDPAAPTSVPYSPGARGTSVFRVSNDSSTSDTTPAAPGSDDPAPDRTSFADLGLDDKVLKALRDVGYEHPSPIQAATIPALLDGRHVVGLAQTGTGKTAAFALPILSRLDLRQKKPQALVLAPTRELALQVCEAFERYAAHLKGVHVLPVYGGQAYGVQLSALRRGVHIVVGTPGRIMDHLEKGTLDLSELRFLVLDEADEMLKMGFAEDVETILADTPDDKHVALFSATMPSQIRRISKKYLHDPVEITVKSTTSTAPNITQRYLTVSYPQKVDALTRILEVENFEGMIVFVRTKNETETLAEKLRARGFSAMAINGDIAQNQRERTVDQLKSGKLDILVATDVAARGLDVDGSATSSTTTSRPTPSPTSTASGVPAERAGAATRSRSSRPANATCSRPSRRRRASRSCR